MFVASFFALIFGLKVSCAVDHFHFYIMKYRDYVKPPGNPRYRCEDIIKMILKNIGCENVGCIVAQDRIL